MMLISSYHLFGIAQYLLIEPMIGRLKVFVGYFTRGNEGDKKAEGPFPAPQTINAFYES
jgi:hypothetical protein